MTARFWLSVRGASDYVDVSTDQIRALITAGALPASDVSLPGSRKARWRIAIADLDRFLAARRNTPPTRTPRRRRPEEYQPRYY
jgi:Helix-turn-helix domain